MQNLKKMSVVLLTFLCLGIIAGAQEKRPNILFIIVDDQSPFDLKVYDQQSSLETPVIDRLAAEGMVFDAAHHMGAWIGGVCTPSRHMIMSGRTLWHIPHKRNPVPADAKYIPKDLPDHTMAAVFNAAGYDTMRTCKRGNSYSAANSKFTVVHDATKRGGTDETGSAWHAEQVLSYLKQREAAQDKDPFLIYFGFSHPHDVRDGKPELLAKYGAVNHRDKENPPPAHPRQPPLPVNYLPAHPFDNTHMNVRDEVNVKGVWTNRDKRTIRNELGREFACSENIDIQIGRVLEQLKAMGELDNTYIFYTADHGIAIGRHGLQGKQNLYEHTWRVPFIVKGPGIQPGTRAPGNIYLLDVLATLCDLAGIEAPQTCEGLSFKPILEGRRERLRDTLYGVYCGGQKPGMRCVKRGDWKLIKYESTQSGVSETQLFNLAENPDELLRQHHDRQVTALTGNNPKAHQVNLAGDPGYADRLEEMEQLLLSQMEKHDDPYRFSNQPQPAPYDGSWESLQQMPVPAWFEDGKIGIFIHWGPYSVIGYRKGGRGYAEHVPKMIYRDPGHYYPYLKRRWGDNPPAFGYKDIIPEFKAENWDPDAWAKLFKDVGAHYVVLTAEHHDGWANWDSDLTPWNAVDMGPKRDIVGDLGKALRARGLNYAPSYHRERHSSFFAEKLYVVDAVPLPDIEEEIKRVPQAASLYGPFGFSKEYVDDYVARWKEIQRKYQPDMLWLDDVPIYTRDGNKVRDGRAEPVIQYFDDQVRAMITDFMNDGAARGADVYLNNKGGNRNWPAGVGCLEKDNLKLKVIGPKWESCTTFGTSFGYLAAEEDPDYPHKKKSVEQVVHEMVEIVSRNGNFLINIGPRADGTIPEWQVERLRAMGNWLRINGEAIYGTRYWKVYAQENERLAFTAKGKTFYAIKLARPAAPFTIEATAGWKKRQVKSVKLIGSKAAVTWKMTPAGLRIAPPDDLGESFFAWSFAVVTGRKQHHPNVIESNEGRALHPSKASGRKVAAFQELAVEVVPKVVVSHTALKGIGVEQGVMRRDPSDVIEVGDLYYVWYSKGKIAPGYDATVWYATSFDGYKWTEKGRALAKGEPGSWEGGSVFTPNILVAEGKYWLFYTGVSKVYKRPYTPDSNIGIAVSDSPDGPWERLAANPALKNSDNPDDFDSHLVDDACLIARDGKYWFYYKGRQLGKSPAQTQMGLAIADHPQGPYVKHAANPVIPGNHEVLVWPQGAGVAAMIGTTGPKDITNSILYAEDGVHFKKTHTVKDGPWAGGAYRPEAFTQSGRGTIPQWGVEIGRARGKLPFIQRFDVEEGK